MWKCIIIDFILGLMPIVGDALDFFWVGNLMMIMRAQRTIHDFECMAASMRYTHPVISLSQGHVVPGTNVQDSVTPLLTPDNLVQLDGYGTFGDKRGLSHVFMAGPSSSSSVSATPPVHRAFTGPTGGVIARYMYAPTGPLPKEKRWLAYFEQIDLAAQNGMDYFSCHLAFQAPNLLDLGIPHAAATTAIAHQPGVNNHHSNNNHNHNHSASCHAGYPANAEIIAHEPDGQPPPPHHRPSYWQEAAMQDALKRQQAEGELPSSVIPIPNANSNVVSQLSSFQLAMCQRLRVEPVDLEALEIENDAEIMCQNELQGSRQSQEQPPEGTRALLTTPQQVSRTSDEIELRLEPGPKFGLSSGLSDGRLHQPTVDNDVVIAQETYDAVASNHASGRDRPVHSNVRKLPKLELDTSSNNGVDDAEMLVQIAMAKRVRLKKLKAKKFVAKRKMTTLGGESEAQQRRRRRRLEDSPNTSAIIAPKKDGQASEEEGRSEQVTVHHHHNPQAVSDGHACLQLSPILAPELVLPSSSPPPPVLHSAAPNPADLDKVSLKCLSIVACALGGDRPDSNKSSFSSADILVGDPAGKTTSATANNGSLPARLGVPTSLTVALSSSVEEGSIDGGSSEDEPSPLSIHGTMVFDRDDSGVGIGILSTEYEAEFEVHGQSWITTPAATQQPVAELMWSQGWSGTDQQEEAKEQEDGDGDETDRHTSPLIRDYFLAQRKAVRVAQVCSSGSGRRKRW
ncbi:hypothetical protein DFQ26_009255 [Actinomortierella ambigua]|nr:hypothetical protein DFQ26_009255 [Actinomortierella ambigua]